MYLTHNFFVSVYHTFYFPFCDGLHLTWITFSSNGKHKGITDWSGVAEHLQQTTIQSVGIYNCYLLGIFCNWFNTEFKLIQFVKKYCVLQVL